MTSDAVGRAKRARRLAAVLWLAASASLADRRPALAAEAAYGEYLAAECASCHRPGGEHGAIPPLQAVPYDTLVSALKDYRDGSRSNAAMQAVARSLGDAEIDALAAYFAGRS